MGIFTLILSGLALLAASVCLILLIQEKKRNQKRNAALCDLLRAECAQVIACIDEFKTSRRLDFAETYGKLDGIVMKIDLIASDVQTRMDGIRESVNAMREDMGTLEKDVEDLKQGVVPDFNEALAAKNAVDSFNKGLSGILGFDPLEHARKQREERMYGGEVD